MDIFRKLSAILMETSEHSNLPAGRIFGTAVQLFRWIALRAEAHIRIAANLKTGIADAIENRVCEHGSRYKRLVKLNAFWDEKRLRTLKDARRATRHHHVAVDGIAPLLDWVKIGTKKKVKERKE